MFDDFLSVSFLFFEILQSTLMILKNGNAKKRIDFERGENLQGLSKVDGKAVSGTRRSSSPVLNVSKEANFVSPLEMTIIKRKLRSFMNIQQLWDLVQKQSNSKRKK